MTRVIVTFGLYKNAMSEAINPPHFADVAPVLLTRPVLPTRQPFKSSLHKSYCVQRTVCIISIFL